MLEDFLGSFSKDLLYFKSDIIQALLVWMDTQLRTHKLFWLQFLTCRGKMQAGYAKSTPSHTCFASVLSNNLGLRSYRRRQVMWVWILRANERTQFGLPVSWLNAWISVATIYPLSCNWKESSHNIFVRSCQPVSHPGGAWQSNTLFLDLLQA